MDPYLQFQCKMLHNEHIEFIEEYSGIFSEVSDHIKGKPAIQHNSVEVYNKWINGKEFRIAQNIVPSIRQIFYTNGKLNTDGERFSSFLAYLSTVETLPTTPASRGERIFETKRGIKHKQTFNFEKNYNRNVNVISYVIDFIQNSIIKDHLNNLTPNIRKIVDQAQKPIPQMILDIVIPSSIFTSNRWKTFFNPEDPKKINTLRLNVKNGILPKIEVDEIVDPRIRKFMRKDLKSFNLALQQWMFGIIDQSIQVIRSRGSILNNDYMFRGIPMLTLNLKDFHGNNNHMTANQLSLLYMIPMVMFLYNEKYAISLIDNTRMKDKVLFSKLFPKRLQFGDEFSEI